jgi:CheY-like chemotaxis protein
MYSGNSGCTTSAVGYGATFSGVKKALNNAKRNNRSSIKIAPSPVVKERILVVNDEDAIREFVCAMLTATGYMCRQAANGVKALAILNSGEQFDLLLSNFRMPEMDGMELLKRTREGFSEIPFVLESGSKDFSVFLPALKMGAYDYLQTPFDREQLLVVVRRALEYRSLKLQNRALRAKLAKRKSAQPEEKMTTEERRETLKDLNGAVTNTLGLIEIMQDPEQEVNREAALGKAHEWAKRAMKVSQEVFFDALKEGRTLR